MARPLGNEAESFEAIKSQSGASDVGLWRFIYHRISDDIAAIRFFCEQFLSSGLPLSERTAKKMLFYNHDIGHTLEFISATSGDELVFGQFRATIPLDPIVRGLFSHHLGNESYAIELIVSSALDSGHPPALTADNAGKILEHCNRVHEFMEHLRDVTYREQPEGKVRESEKKLRGLFETCKDPIIRFDLHGRVVDANDAAAQLLGYSPQELRLLKHTDLSDRRWHEAEKKVIGSQVMKRGYSDVLEEEFLRKDASPVPVAVRMWLIRDEQGEPSGIWAFIRDTSGQRSVERALLAEVSQFRQLFEKIGDGVTLSDAQGHFEIFNRMMTLITGYTIDDVAVAGDFNALIYPDPQERQRALAGISDMRKGQESWECETTVTCRDGLRKTLLVETSRVSYAGREMFLSVYHDISNRVELEAVVVNSEELFRATFEQATIGMALINIEGHYTMVNSMFCAIVGYSEAELLDKGYADLTIEEDIPASLALQRQMLSGERMAVRLEKRYRNKSGKTVWADVNSVLVRDRQGKPAFFVTQVVDITERKEAESALARSEEQYRRIFTDCVLGIFRTTPQGRCLVANPTFARLFGFATAEQMISEVNDMADLYVQRKDRENFKDEMQQSGEVHDYQLWILRKDGKQAYLSINAKTFFDAHGKAAYYDGTAVDVTARKEAEVSLVKSAAEWKQIFDAAHETILLVDAEHTILRANAAAVKLIGRPMYEIIGEKYFHLIHGSESPLPDCPLTVCQRTGLHAEQEMYNADKKRWLFSSVDPVEGDAGQGKHFVLTIADVTSRKIAELRLKEEHDRARMYFDVAGSLFLVLELDGTIRDINDSGSQLLGFARRDLVGRDWFTACIPERMRDQVRYVFETIKAGENRLTSLYENPVVTHSGEERLILWHNTVLKNEQGNMTGILCSGQDVTERRAVQLKVLRAKQRYDDLVSNLKVGIFRLASAEIGTVIDVNTAFLAIFGAGEKSDLMLHNFWDLFEDQSTARQVKKDLLAESHVANVEFRPAGATEFRWCSFSAYIGVDENNKQIVDGIVEDITVFKSNEAKLKNLVEQVQVSNKRLEQLSLTDYQTGLFNHRYFSKYIESEFDRARRYMQPLSVMMMDLDFFKSVNDVYGHAFGDVVLRQFARELRKCVRQYDMVIRMGGEEFLVVCPQSDRAAALLLANRIMEHVLKVSFGTAKTKIKLKVSIGVCAYPEEMVRNATMLVDCADQALTRAKEAGGCRVISSSDREPVSAALPANGNVVLLLEKIGGLNKRAHQSVTEAIYAFAKTIELKDHYTGEHGEATVSFARGIARQLGISGEDAELIGQAAMIHDLGKIGVPESILCKPGKLTKPEFEQIKRHPLIAASILRPIHFLHPLIPLILYHHERWDGKGYPHGLKGSEIPLKAQVIAMADVFQALVSERPYRKAYSRQEAVDLVSEGSGSQFSDQVVNALKEYLAA